MVGWLKRRLLAWVGRYEQREIERLHAELVQRNADALRSNGGKPIRLSPDQHQRLNELRQKIDPEALGRIDLLAAQSSVLMETEVTNCTGFTVGFIF